MDDEPHDFRFMEIPAYRSWSKRKLDDGEYPALIAHLDASCMWMRPSELASVTEADLDEILQELREDLERLEE